MEWKEDKLGNVIQVKYGKDHKKLENGEYPCYGSGGLMRFVESKIYDGPSILIPRKGTLNNIMYSETPFWTVDTMFWSIIDQDKIDPKYLFYHICKKDFAGMNVGSAVPSMTIPILNDIDIYYPQRIEDQKRIADILSSLDAKIENNNKINAKLEEMAQALFKSWFIDFEPFKDGPFVESELGMIPEGWKVGCIADLGTIVCGKTPSKSIDEYYGGNIPFVKIPDMHNHVFVNQSEDSLSEEGNRSQIKKLIPAYSLMVSCIATVGLVAINTKPSHTNQQINSLIPKKHSYLYYLYEFMIGQTEYLMNLGRGGTATLNVNTKTFSNIRMLIPSEEVLDKFSILIEPIFKRIENNIFENDNLAQTRDTLLPKLMSGEIEL